MKINNFLLVAIALSFVSISSMEEVEPLQEMNKTRVHQISRPSKFPSLVDIVSKKIIWPLVDKAVEIYDNEKSKESDNAYKAFNGYLNSSAEQIKLTKEFFDGIVYDYITDNLSREDIFGEYLLDLFRDGTEEQTIIDFFNQFNLETKAVIVYWMICELDDMHYFNSDHFEDKIQIDEDNKPYCILIDDITELLALLIENNQNIDFYDLLINIFKKVKSKFPINIDANILGINPEQEKEVHHLWDERGKFQLIFSGNWNQNCLAEIIQHYFHLICNYANYINFKIDFLIDLTKDYFVKSVKQHESSFREDLEKVGTVLLALFEEYEQAAISEQDLIKNKLYELVKKCGKNLLDEIIDYLFSSYFLKKDNKVNVLKFIDFIYPNEASKNNQFMQIFKMLDKQYPEYVKLSYRKNLAELDSRIKLISDIQEAARNIPINSLKPLLIANTENKNDNEIIEILDYYYRLLGLEFVDNLLMFIIVREFNDEKHEVQIDILNNLHDLILKFAEKYDIDKENFRSKFDLINEMKQSIS